MQCPHDCLIEKSDIFNEEQNISQIMDYNDELNLTKKESLEEFLGGQDDSTEISYLLNSLDSNSITFTFETRTQSLNDESESVSEILTILKKHPNSTRHKNEDKYTSPFSTGSSTGPKKVSLSGKVLTETKTSPVRVHRPVLLKTSVISLQQL